MTFGMYGLLFLTPLALQSLRGASTSLTGAALLPMSVVFALVSTFSQRFVVRLGTRRTIAAGMACMGAGSLALAADVTAHWWLLAPGLAVVGVGLGLTTGPLLGYAVGRAPSERAGAASGIGNAARMLGATLGVAVLGGAFAHVSSVDVLPLRLAYVGGGVAELAGVAIAWLGITEPLG